MITVTEEELFDGTIGACLECGEKQSGVEPDAEKYICESCGEPSVYGLEQLLILEEIDVVS